MSVLAEEHFVQKFDAVPQFWQFLSGLRFDDLIVELVQNDLDAGASRTSITFHVDRLACHGNGESVGEDGWRRLGYVVGAGDQVSRKRAGIGAKNHGLKACFRLGDQIIVRSDGRRMVQTLYKDGPNQPPSPGTLPSPVSDSGAPDVGCAIEVPYRQNELVVPKGEAFRLGPTDEAVVKELFRNACLLLPTRLFGVVRPGVRNEYTLCLHHHALGTVELHWRAKRARALNNRGRKRLLLFNRECRMDSVVRDLPSKTTFEQACVFGVALPSGRPMEVSKFFASDRRSFGAEIAWATNRNGKLLLGEGVRRYPIGYDAKSESAVTGLSVHFSGPYISDAERHGASQAENLNDYIDQACKDALVDAMASHLLHRYRGAAMQLYLPTRPDHDDRLLSELVENAIRKQAIPLNGRPHRGKRGGRIALGPRKHVTGGSRRIVLPLFTWDGERTSRMLSDVCPGYEDQIDPNVPPPILTYLVGRDSRLGHDTFITFDEADAIGRLQPLVGTAFFPWKDEGEWQNALSKASVAECYLDVVWEAARHGPLESEEDIVLNAHLPDHSSIARPFEEMYCAVNVPRSLGQREYVPLVHPHLQGHRLLKRRAWKPRPFGLDDFLDGAKLKSASLGERQSFWDWLRSHWSTVSRPTLKRIAKLPVWPAADGGLRPLDALCEPRNVRVGEILADAICRPSSQLLRTGLVGTRGAGRLVLRWEPTVREVSNFLATQLGGFGEERPLGPGQRREFHRLEDSLVALASARGLRRALSELSDEFAVALSGDGILRPPGDLVRPDGYVGDLHLPARHLMTRANRKLDGVDGWGARPHPSARQIVDALVEDGARVAAHIRRLLEYVRQTKREGRSADDLANVPCIPMPRGLYRPRDVALRGRLDVWGEWKLRVPVTGLSAEVQRIYRAVGVGPGAPDLVNSMLFFRWLASQSGGVVASHVDQILRHIGHKSGPGKWGEGSPNIPFIAVESDGGTAILVTRAEATKVRSRVVIPDVDQLAVEVRKLDAKRPVVLAIVDSPNVTHPITAYLRRIGVKMLSEYAGEPIQVSGKAHRGSPTVNLHHVLASLRSGRKGKQLHKRLAKLGLDSVESRLRTNWRERLSAIARVEVADAVDATYKLGRRRFRISVDGKLDKATGTLWLRSGADLRASFFDALADHVFEQPQKYYGSVLDRAYRMQLKEHNPLYESASEPFEGDQSVDEEPADDDAVGPTETAANHPALRVDLSNTPNPRELPASAGTATNAGTTTTPPNSSGTSRRIQTIEETAQILDLKERHYAWHCQVCIGDTEPGTLAPSRSYAARPEHRKPIIDAHHCDHVNAGGALHAGNILLLCRYHHHSLGDAFSRAEVVEALGHAQWRRMAFDSGNGNSTTLRGKVATVRPVQRCDNVTLFFTTEHASYWLAKAKEDGLR